MFSLSPFASSLPVRLDSSSANSAVTVRASSQKVDYSKTAGTFQQFYNARQARSTHHPPPPSLCFFPTSLAQFNTLSNTVPQNLELMTPEELGHLLAGDDYLVLNVSPSEFFELEEVIGSRAYVFKELCSGRY